MALLVVATITVSAQEDRTFRIRFARGRTSKVIKEAVVRGTRDRYVLAAKAGQRMSVHVASLENNAVFSVYMQGDQQPIEASEVTEWSNRLPRSGSYVIEVGGTRGNASYTLKVTIR